MSPQPPSLNFSRLGVVLFWGYLFLLVVLFGTSQNPADPDLWWHFAFFDYVSHTGHFPTGDVFSYDAYPQIVPNHEWGNALIFYPVYFWAGSSWLVLLKLAIIGTTLTFIVRAALGNRAPTMLDTFFFSLVLLALLSSLLSTIRAAAFTHLFLALWFWWLQSERRGRKIPRAAYVMTTILWANLHGGFIIGFGLLAVTGVLEFFNGGDWKRRAWVLLCCLLATLVNPFGYKIWISVGQAVFIPRPNFPEWEPVSWFHDFGQFSAYKLLVLWMVVVVIGHIRQVGWKKCDQTAVILLVLFLVPSLVHVRHTSIFAIAVGALLPPLFPPEISVHDIRGWKPWLHRFVVRAILVVLPLIFAWRLLPTNQGLRLTYPIESCPIDAVNYLKHSGTTGNLLVGFNSGSYALWELRGQMRVSVDGRFDISYPIEIFNKNQRFFSGEDRWRDALTDPKPDAVLVNRPDGVYPKMLVEPGWTLVYQDATHAVFRPNASVKSPQ
jgi:hypothetical protein